MEKVCPHTDSKGRGSRRPEFFAQQCRNDNIGARNSSPYLSVSAGVPVVQDNPPPKAASGCKTTETNLPLFPVFRMVVSDSVAFMKLKPPPDDLTATAAKMLPDFPSLVINPARRVWSWRITPGLSIAPHSYCCCKLFCTAKEDTSMN